MRKYLLLLFLLPSAFVFGQDGFYDLENIPEIKLYFERDNWKDILTRMKVAGKKQRMSAKLVLDGATYEEVGVRFKGNSSFKNVKKGGAKKLPFNIKIDHKQEQELPSGHKTIKLSNIFRDPSCVREVLSYEIARKYIPAPEANFAKLYVNDEYLGLYNNTESIDKSFLKKNLKDNDGTLIKCDPEWGMKAIPNCKKGDKSSLMYLGDDARCYLANYELKSEDGYDGFIKFIEAINNKKENLADHLDVDQTLWMHAFNNVLVNLDSYTGRLSHNFYMYKGKDEVFQPLVWDMNLSFGGFKFDGNGKSLDNRGLQRLSPMVHFKNRNTKRPLIINLLQKELNRKIYLAHIRTILDENFRNNEYETRAKAIQAVIDAEVNADPNKLYSYEAFKANMDATTDAGGTDIIGITELMKGRLEYLNAHPLLNHEPPTISKVEDLHFGEEVAIQAHLENATGAYVFYRYSKKQPWQSMKMRDDGGHNDESTEDGIWGATLEFNKKTQYYVVAENDLAAATFPRRTSGKPNKVKE